VGWQWKIPLQHRTGNGYVFSTAYLSDAEALEVLRGNIQGELLAEPRFISFKAGQRKENWAKNCVALGLAGGFLEPLESTSIYLIQFGIQKLLEYFPDAEFCPENRRAFNRDLDAEYLKLRDFIIMHYKETQRTDSDFWRDCQTMVLPDSLGQRQRLFGSLGYVDPQQYGIYAAVCLGQQLMPRQQDWKIGQVPQASIDTYLAQLRADIATQVTLMPDAQEFIESLSRTSLSSQGR
jgi:tryptophan 7-halogenase